MPQNDKGLYEIPPVRPQAASCSLRPTHATTLAVLASLRDTIVPCRAAEPIFGMPSSSSHATKRQRTLRDPTCPASSCIMLAPADPCNNLGGLSVFARYHCAVQSRRAGP